MVKFGDTTLPNVLTIKQQHSTILQEVPLPYRRFAYRKWMGGKGLMFNIGGYLMPADDLTPSFLRGLADGVPRALDLESTEVVRLEAALRYQPVGPIWTDDAVEAGTSGGTPFTLIDKQQIATNKTVVASSEDSGGGNWDHKAVDGNVGTRWRSNDETHPWIYIDLGESLLVCGMRVDWENACSDNYLLQYSDNGTDWTTFANYTAFPNYNNWQDYPVYLTARYWRWYDNRSGSHALSIWEWEIYVTDYFYFGHAEKWNEITFDLDTLGSYGLIDWEYSQGDSAWATLDELYDHFLGTTLNPALWSLIAGTATVASSLLSCSNGADVRSSSFDAYHRTTFRITPGQTNSQFRAYSLYNSDSMRIALGFVESGHFYLECADATGYSYSDCGVYTTDPATYVITWRPGRVQAFRNGTFLTYLDGHVPTEAGPIRLYGTWSGALFDVDYVNALDDGTCDFSQDGALTFTPPSDWAIDEVDEITNKFWLRAKATKITTAATVKEIWLQQIYNCIMLDPLFTKNVEKYKRIDYSLSFAQQENP